MLKGTPSPMSHDRWYIWHDSSPCARAAHLSMFHISQPVISTLSTLCGMSWEFSVTKNYRTAQVPSTLMRATFALCVD